MNFPKFLLWSGILTKLSRLGGERNFLHNHHFDKYFLFLQVLITAMYFPLQVPIIAMYFHSDDSDPIARGDLAGWTPESREVYLDRAKRLLSEGWELVETSEPTIPNVTEDMFGFSHPEPGAMFTWVVFIHRAQKKSFAIWQFGSQLEGAPGYVRTCESQSASLRKQSFISSCACYNVVNALPVHGIISWLNHWLNDIMPCAVKCLMPWSHLCVKSPRKSHVLKRNYRNQNKLRDIEEDAHVNSF